MIRNVIYNCNKKQMHNLPIILEDGDICQWKSWDGNMRFGMYFKETIIHSQPDGLVCGLGGYEQYLIRVLRPACMRNSFQMFKDGNYLNENYEEFGEFRIIYEKSTEGE